MPKHIFRKFKCLREKKYTISAGMEMQHVPEFYYNTIHEAGNIQGKVLDIGCNRGETMRLLTEKYLDIKLFGIDTDYSFKMLKEAKYYGQVCKADLNYLPFKNGSFDVIFLLGVLMYIINPGQSLREINRVLNNKGKLIISVSNKNYDALMRIKSKIKKTNLLSENKNAYLKHFSYLEIKKLLERNGLKIIKERKSGPTPILNNLLYNLPKGLYLTKRIWIMACKV